MWQRIKSNGYNEQKLVLHILNINFQSDALYAKFKS